MAQKFESDLSHIYSLVDHLKHVAFYFQEYETSFQKVVLPEQAKK